MPKPSKELVKLVEKALRPREKPHNTEVVEAILQLTYRTLDVSILWSADEKWHLAINRFSAWRYCHLLHWILRDGHPQILRDACAQKVDGRLADMAAHWSRQQAEQRQQYDLSGYITSYLTALQVKVQFHANYPFVSNQLLAAGEVLDTNLNVCIQLCTDAFELFDRLMAVLLPVLHEIQVLRSAKLTSPPTQCRLLPLATIAAECHGLYGLAATVLERLYSQMMYVDLRDQLRARFEDVFGQLTHSFSALRQFKAVSVAMHKIPLMPSNAPQFYASIYPRIIQEPSAPPDTYVDI